MRRPVMQRREEQTEKHDHQAAEAGEQVMPHDVDLSLKPRFEELQVLLGRDVAWIASKISVAMRSAALRSMLASASALVRESRSVSGASANALRNSRCGTGRPGCTPYSSPNSIYSPIVPSKVQQPRYHRLRWSNKVDTVVLAPTASMCSKRARSPSPAQPPKCAATEPSGTGCWHCSTAGLDPDFQRKRFPLFFPCISAAVPLRLPLQFRCPAE